MKIHFTVLRIILLMLNAFMLKQFELFASGVSVECFS